MEKNNGGKIIAVIALVVAIAGLSLGFAAFSTSLKIDTAAKVSSDANWNVGFSVNGSDIANVTTATTKNANNSNPGVIDVTKYTISQNTNATLSTTENSSVSYNLYILNKGTLDAYLESVNFSNVTMTCSNATGSGLVEGVAGAGTTKSGNTSTISNEDCAKMFKVELSIDGTPYDTTTSNITGKIISKTAGSNSVPVILTVSYKNDAAAKAVADTLDGDIIVNIGSITVSYTSTNTGS